MLEESVHVTDVTNPHVTARFVFRNDGPATDVLIGFPDMGSMSGIENTTPPGLKHFRSFVDGKPIAVRRVFSHHGLPNGLAEDYDYLAWEIKRVHFGAHQTHVIVDEYDGGGGSDTEAQFWFAYVLRTGASWKGTIGRAVVTVDLGPLVGYSPVEIYPAGYVRRGSTVTWDLRNIKPSHDIQIYWDPGFLDMAVNGYFPFATGDNRGRPDWRDFVLGAYGPADFDSVSNPPDLAPVKRNEDIWLPLQTAASLLGARFRVLVPGRAYRIEDGSRWVEIRIGSRKVTRSDGRLFIMPGSAERQVAPHSRASMAMVYLIPLVHAFGGTAEFTNNGAHLSVRVPNKHAPSPAP